MKKLDQKGFGLIESLLTIIIVVLVVFVGYYIWHTQKQNNKSASKVSTISNADLKQGASSQKTNKSQTSPYAGWKQYCDSLSIGCIKYPANWTLDTSQSDMAEVITPQGSAHPTNVTFQSAVHGPGDTTGDTVVATSDLAVPISGLEVVEGIDNSADAPYIDIVDSSGRTDINKTWALGAVPTDLPYSSMSQATAWFSTDEAKTALKIVQSFTYK